MEKSLVNFLSHCCPWDFGFCFQFFGAGVVKLFLNGKG